MGAHDGTANGHTSGSQARVSAEPAPATTVETTGTGRMPSDVAAWPATTEGSRMRRTTEACGPMPSRRVQVRRTGVPRRP
jgi:hypothetical protein